MGVNQMKSFYTIIFTIGCLLSSASYAMEARANLTAEQYEQLEKLITQRNQPEVQSFLQKHNINEKHRLPRIKAHRFVTPGRGDKSVDTKQLMKAKSKVTDPIAVGLLGASKCVLGLICLNNTEKFADASWIANLAGVSLYVKGLLQIIQPHNPSKEKNVLRKD